MVLEKKKNRINLCGQGKNNTIARDINYEMTLSNRI
jgi:hypothetical protein